MATASARDRAEEAFDIIRASMAAMPIVRGSTLQMFSNEILPVGDRAGFVLRVPSIDAADFEDEHHVQRSRALDGLRDRVIAALGDDASVPSWQIHDGSELFLAVRSEEQARSVVQPLIVSDPLLDGATLTRYARGAA